jgi:hypothetical protein
MKHSKYFALPEASKRAIRSSNVGYEYEGWFRFCGLGILPGVERLSRKAENDNAQPSALRYNSDTFVSIE